APLLSITEQPSGGDACAGEPFAFTVATRGSNIRYQWRKNGIDIPGATSRVYALDAVTGADAGAYTVAVASDDYRANGEPATPADSTLVSHAARLVVHIAPAISSQPAGASLCRGMPYSFTVKATGDGLVYQWRHDGVVIPGASSAAYSIAATDSIDAGYYD